MPALIGWLVNIILGLSAAKYMWQHHQPTLLTLWYGAKGAAKRGGRQAEAISKKLFWAALIELSLLILLFTVALVSYLVKSPKPLYWVTGIGTFATFAISGAVVTVWWPIRGMINSAASVTKATRSIAYAINSPVRILRDIHTGLTMAWLVIAAFLLFDYTWGWHFLNDWAGFLALVIIGIAAATVVLAERQTFQLVTYASMMTLIFVLCTASWIGHSNPAMAHGIVKSWRNVQARGGKASQSGALNSATGNIGQYRRVVQSGGAEVFAKIDDKFSATGALVPFGRHCFLGVEAELETDEKSGLDLVKGFCPDSLTVGAVIGAADHQDKWVWLPLQHTEPAGDPLQARKP